MIQNVKVSKTVNIVFENTPAGNVSIEYEFNSNEPNAYRLTGNN
jgi:hypothetical protein